MSPRKTRKEDKALNSQHFLKYSDVSSLNASDLKNLCVKHNIQLDFPKKAKILFLCHILGISACGNAKNQKNSSSPSSDLLSLSGKQVEEYERLTPKFLCQIRGWTKNLLQVPDLDESSVKKYLLNTSVIDSQTARMYKVSRPYQLKPFVHSIRYFPNSESETFAVIAARCNPSQSTNSDDVKVIFAIINKTNGLPYGGYCTCTVGLTQRCGHVGATLFRVADLVTSGVKEVPDDEKSCTDTLCSWRDPKGAAAQPTVFDELRISKKQRTIKRTARDFGKKISNTDPPSYDAVLQLKSSLFAATHHLGQHCPAAHVINATRFNLEPSQEPYIYKQLPNVASANDPSIAYSHEETVKSQPMPISQMTVFLPVLNDTGNLSQQCDKFLQLCRFTKADRDHIELITLGQSTNLQWFQQKKGAITGSKFARVLRSVEKNTASDSLIIDIVGYKAPTTIRMTTVPSLKWGLENEKNARRLYIQKFHLWHKNLHIEEKGLVVHEEYHFIRASPDGVIHCQCHEDKLLEIKCPFASRHMTIDEAVNEKKIKFLETQNGRLVLKRNATEGYFEQVQGTMAIMNLKICNFVIWTLKDIKIVQVPFDEEFWKNRLLPACQKFFSDSIIPEILTKKRRVPANNLSCVRVTTEQVAVAKTQSNTGQSARKKPSPINSLTTSTTDDGYRCGQCTKNLPESNIAPDNSDASVGCDCQNCGCDVWYCWPCAGYDDKQREDNKDWYCPQCARNCEVN